MLSRVLDTLVTIENKMYFRPKATVKITVQVWAERN